MKWLDSGYILEAKPMDITPIVLQFSRLENEDNNSYLPIS